MNDPIRGIPADQIIYDDVQDVTGEEIPLIRETTSPGVWSPDVSPEASLLPHQEKDIKDALARGEEVTLIDDKGEKFTVTGCDNGTLTIGMPMAPWNHDAVMRATKAVEALAKVTQKPEEVHESEARMEERRTIVNTGKAFGRNEPCPCGSGKKNKKCCNLRVQYREKVKRKLVVIDPKVAEKLRKAQRSGKSIKVVKS